MLVLNTTQRDQLLLDNHFIEYEYLPSKEVDLEKGRIRSAFGLQVGSSTFVPPGTAYAIDVSVAGVMLIRRDTIDEYSELMKVDSVLGRKQGSAHHTEE